MIARLSIAIVDVNLPLVVYGCFLASVSFCDVQSITSLFKYIYISVILISVSLSFYYVMLFTFMNYLLIRYFTVHAIIFL